MLGLNRFRPERAHVYADLRSHVDDIGFYYKHLCLCVC
jgi:hypothetical protein